jgi:hypothetical protein
MAGEESAVVGTQLLARDWHIVKSNLFDWKLQKPTGEVNCLCSVHAIAAEGIEMEKPPARRLIASAVLRPVEVNQNPEGVVVFVTYNEGDYAKVVPRDGFI